MKKWSMEVGQKFKKGDVVYDRIRPAQKLIVADVIGKVYHCLIYENQHRKPLVYFERDLKGTD